jgi:hypothetical protein
MIDEPAGQRGAARLDSPNRRRSPGGRRASSPALVNGLMQQHGDPVAVARRLQSDPPHAEWLLCAAEQAL